MFRFSLTVWLAMASVAAAADPVLMAFGKWGQGKIFPATSEATLGVFVPGSSYAITVTAADVGRVFPLPPDKVAAFASPFTDSIQADPYRLIGGICCYGPSNWVDNIDVAWADGGNGLDGYRFVRHVPVADFELRGYKVTSVEMIVDKLQFDTVNKHTTITAEYSTVWRGTPISAIPGDFNIDGNVDAADYVTWRNALNSVTPLPNGTGTVPWYQDRDIWLANFGRNVPGLSNSAAIGVPEPNTVELVTFVFVLYLLFMQCQQLNRLSDIRSRLPRRPSVPQLPANDDVPIKPTPPDIVVLREGDVSV